MKRWTTILLSVALGVSLAACGADGAQRMTGAAPPNAAADAGGKAAAEAARASAPDGSAGAGGTERGGESAGERGEPKYKPEDVDPAVIAAHNRFALDFFREAYAREEKSPNIFLSPISAVLALSMTMNGADGDTLAAMKEALRMEGIGERTILESHRALADLLVRSEGARIDIANSLWPDEGVDFLAPFIAANL